MILALYANEIVPQDYGVAKHPLFFMEKLIQRNSPYLHSLIFSDESHLVSFKDDNELNEEDMDAKAEREKVYALQRSQYDRFPLVIKDIRKVYPGFNGQPPKIANKNISLRV